MKQYAGLSEILAAVAIIAVSVVVGAAVFLNYSEQQKDVSDTISARLELNEMEATELIAVSHPSHILQTRQFILHNYSDDHEIKRDELDVYVVSEIGEINKMPQSGLQMATQSGSGTDSIKPQQSGVIKFTGLNCERTLVLMTSTSEMIMVHPPIEANCLDKCPDDHTEGDGVCVPRCPELGRNWDPNANSGNGGCVVEKKGVYFWDANNNDSFDDTTEHVMNPCSDPAKRYDSNAGRCVTACTGLEVWMVVSQSCENRGSGKIFCINTDEKFENGACVDKCKTDEDWDAVSKKCVVRLSAIKGEVWWDLDEDGAKNGSELAHSGLEVGAYNHQTTSKINSSRSDSLGNYSFNAKIKKTGADVKPVSLPDNAKLTTADSRYVPYRNLSVTFNIGMTCESSHSYNSGQCVSKCPSESIVWSVTHNSCVSVCPAHQEWDASAKACADRCPDSNKEWDSGTQTCVLLQCPHGQKKVKGTCQNLNCGVNEEPSGNICVSCNADEKSAGGQDTCSPLNCAAGKVAEGHKCVNNTCSAGKEKVNGVCLDKCKPGETRDGTLCKKITTLQTPCPYGFRLIGGICYQNCASDEIQSGTVCKKRSTPGTNTVYKTCGYNQIVVGNACKTCGENRVAVGNVCKLCADDQEVKNGACSTLICLDDEEAKNHTCQKLVCPGHQEAKNNACHDLVCTSGFEAKNNTCESVTCGAHNIVVNGSCQKCNDDEHVFNNKCVKVPCAPTPNGNPGINIVENHKCKFVSCPPGEISRNNKCAKLKCTDYQVILPHSCLQCTAQDGKLFEYEVKNNKCVIGKICAYNEVTKNGKCTKLVCPTQHALNGHKCIKCRADQKVSTSGKWCLNIIGCNALDGSNFRLNIINHQCVKTSCALPDGSLMRILSKNNTCTDLRPCPQDQVTKNNICVPLYCKVGYEAKLWECKKIT